MQEQKDQDDVYTTSKKPTSPSKTKKTLPIKLLLKWKTTESYKNTLKKEPYKL